MSKGIYKNAATPPHDSDIAMVSRSEVYDLMNQFGKVIDTYFEKESIVHHDERFLVVSRALNAMGIDWMRHFWNEFNPEIYYKKKDQRDYG